MRVLLIGNYENDQQESMQRFAHVLESELHRQGYVVKLLKPPAVFGALKKSSNGIGKWLGYLDKLLIFPFIITRHARRFDVVHICDHSNAFYLRLLQNHPHLLTCNDLIAIRSALGELGKRPKFTGRLYQKLILNGINSARRVVCISNSTRDDLLRISSLPASLVSVIYMGQNYQYAPMSKLQAAKYLNKNDLINTPYFLHVGSNVFHKNRLGVIKIFSHLVEKLPKYRLVMAGQPFTRQMQAFVSQNGLVHKVIELQNVSNEALRALYSHAEALIFPSLYEGFGWPIVEAQACGCLVVTSDRAPMTEVGGNGAVYIDPEDAKGAANYILARLSMCNGEIKQGFENVTRFPTNIMIEKYLLEYREAMEGGA